MNSEITVDMETLQLIAKAAAQAAAKDVSESLRDEMRQEFARMESNLTHKMDGYFGSMDPARHVVQHDRLDRMLLLFDRMGENIFSSILKHVVWGLLVMGVIGYLLWLKFTGGAG